MNDINVQLKNLIALYKNNDDKIFFSFFTELFEYAKINNIIENINKEIVLNIEDIFPNEEKIATIINYFPHLYKKNKNILLKSLDKLSYENKFQDFELIKEFQGELTIEDINFLFKNIIVNKSESEYTKQYKLPIETIRIPMLTKEFVNKEIYCSEDFLYRKDILDNQESFLIILNKLSKVNNSDIDEKHIKDIFKRIATNALYLDKTEFKEQFEYAKQAFPDFDYSFYYFTDYFKGLTNDPNYVSLNRFNKFTQIQEKNYKDTEYNGIPGLFYSVLFSNKSYKNVSENTLKNTLSIKSSSGTTIFPYILFSKQRDSASLDEIMKKNYEINKESSLLKDLSSFLLDDRFNLVKEILTTNNNKKSFFNFIIDSDHDLNDFIRRGLSDEESLSTMQSLYNKNSTLAINLFLNIRNDFEFLGNETITKYLCELIINKTYIPKKIKEGMYFKYYEHLDSNVINHYRTNNEKNSELKDFLEWKVALDKQKLSRIFTETTETIQPKKSRL